MMGYGWGAWGGFWMLGGLLVMIGVIVLVVWAISTMTRTGRPSSSDSTRPTPNDILRERFARGEITEAEFEQAKKALGPDR
jgi:putative membrane protein